MDAIIDRARQLQTYVRDRHYHYRNGQNARKVLKSIEAAKGPTSPAVIRLADAYARDVLGWQGYAPWLHVYCAVNGEFKEGWVPENYYSRVVLPRIKGEYGRVSRIKTLTRKMIQDESLSNHLIPDIAYSMTGLYLRRNYEVIAPADLKSHLFREFERIVFKQDDSGQGKGIYFFDKESFEEKSVHDLGNGVFQNWIAQHEAFDPVSPTAVATLRVTTAVDNFQEISVRSCYLRMGRSGSTHIQSSQSVRASVEMKTGKLGEHALTYNWHTVMHHPDTGVAFHTVEIPQFQECLATAIRMHKQVPFVRCIGWDMVVDRDNRVNVMEWNGHLNEIKFPEATQGPCFADLGWEHLWKQQK